MNIMHHIGKPSKKVSTFSANLGKNSHPFRQFYGLLYFTIFALIKYFVLFSKASPKRNWGTL